jgi:hypothetical protein
MALLCDHFPDNRQYTVRGRAGEALDDSKARNCKIGGKGQHVLVKSKHNCSLISYLYKMTT